MTDLYSNVACRVGTFEVVINDTFKLVKTAGVSVTCIKREMNATFRELAQNRETGLNGIKFTLEHIIKLGCKGAVAIAEMKMALGVTEGRR